MPIKNAGFTLLEVMVAIAILALSLASVYHLQSQSISLSIESRFKTTAALLAQSKMAELEMASVLNNRTESGDFGSDFPQYGWKLEITDTELALFKKISVTIFNKAFSSGGNYQLILYKTAGS